MTRAKDWGSTPSVLEIQDMINVIPALEQKAREADVRAADARRDLEEADRQLLHARDELGRMMKAKGLLSSGSFRVVHQDEVRGEALSLFGIHEVREK